MKQTVLYVLLATVLLVACAPAAPVVSTSLNPATEQVAMSINLTSDAFQQGGPIPEKYTCKGTNVSPALAWNDPPAGTQTFALIMDDPDAPSGTWVHWVLFNIPVSSRGLPEAIPVDETLLDGSISGTSSFGRTGYGGPCPPSGTHHYHFKLYALDEMLGIPVGADKGELEKAMVGHVLAQAELMGTFSQ